MSTVAWPVPSPASLAFGVAPFDACRLYATSLFGDTVVSIGVR